MTETIRPDCWKNHAEGEQTKPPEIGDPAIRPANAPACTLPPEGWSCTRIKGHSGPCAAVPKETAQHAAGEGKPVGTSPDHFDRLFDEMDAALLRAGFKPMGTVRPDLAKEDTSGLMYCGDYQHRAIKQINELARAERRHKLWHRIVEAIFVLLLVSLTLLIGKAHGATITCIAPTQNTDGSALTNLAGYEVLYGTSPTALNLGASFNASVCRFIIDPPSTGTWYYAVRAFNTAGVRSANSTVVSKAEDGPPPPPVAVPAPPTSPAVIGREVYQIVQQTDRLVFLPVGTVSNAQACRPEYPVGQYFVVPRAAVSWYGSVRPMVVVTRCNQ